MRLVRPMTAARSLRAVVAWWYIVAAGAAVTAGAVVLAGRVEGVYWTEVSVVFLPPAGSGNVLEGHSQSLIGFAGAVEREVNEGSREPRLSSPNATLYGAGVRDGVSVELPDSGGQWESAFDRAALTVEVVGATPEAVSRRLTEVVGRIDTVIERRQRAAGVGESGFIATIVAPATPSVQHVQGSDGRARLALVLLGAGTTYAAVVLAEERRPRVVGRAPGHLAREGHAAHA
jgi:hypothetical protein